MSIFMAFVAVAIIFIQGVGAAGNIQEGDWINLSLNVGCALIWAWILHMMMEQYFDRRR